MGGGKAAFVITLARTFLGLGLGLALLLQPDKGKVMLANLMGLYWLTSGIISLR